MNTTPLPLLAVGRDCDCGHPLIWWKHHQRCAVYGRHQPPEPLNHYRNEHAPLAWLVDLLDDLPLPNNIGRTRRTDYQKAAP